MFELQMADTAPYGDYRHIVHMAGIHLQRARNGAARILVVGVARAEEPLRELDFIARRLNEIRALFDKRRD